MQQLPLQVTVWVWVPVPQITLQGLQSPSALHTSGYGALAQAISLGGCVVGSQQPVSQVTAWVHFPAGLPQSPVHVPQVPTSQVPLSHAWGSISAGSIAVV